MKANDDGFPIHDPPDILMIGQSPAKTNRHWQEKKNKMVSLIG